MLSNLIDSGCALEKPLHNKPRCLPTIPFKTESNYQANTDRNTAQLYELICFRRCSMKQYSRAGMSNLQPTAYSNFLDIFSTLYRGLSQTESGELA